MSNYYDILEVGHDASEADIKRAYHKLALRYHPDKAGEEGAVKMREINAAYEVLSDPKKKAIYDKYGEAALNAMDNPMTNSAVAALGGTVTELVLSLIVILCIIMIILFASFIGAYVDGHLSSSWNYVKVFSPLFVVDVLIGAPVVLALIPSLVIASRVDVFFVLLSIISLVILSIVIPIAKDRNERRMAQGSANFIKWRVWLIPGYLFSLFVLLATLIMHFPSRVRMAKVRARGMPHLAHYLPVSFILKVLQVLCIAAFFALIGCRADETLTTNYFVIIGVPFFVCGGLFLIDRFLILVFQAVYFRPAEDAKDEEMHENPMGSRNSQCRDEADEAQASQKNKGATGQQPSGNKKDDAKQGDRNDDAKPRPRKSSSEKRATCSCARFRLILPTFCAFALLIGLIFASVAMISVRLNYYSVHHTYDGVLSLGKALIPIYILLGIIFLFAVIMIIAISCVGVVTPVDPPQAPEQSEHGEEGATGNRTEADADDAREDGPQGESAHHNRVHSSVTPLDHHPDNNNENTQAPSHNENPNTPQKQTEKLEDID